MFRSEALKQMKVVFITRSTLYTVKGGDTIQVMKTAEALQKAGVAVDIRLCDEKNIDYSNHYL